jgi:hypothetical protein
MAKAFTLVIQAWEEKYQEGAERTHNNDALFQAALMAHNYHENKWEPDEYEFQLLMHIGCGLEDDTFYKYHLTEEELEGIHELARAICKSMKHRSNNIEYAKKQLGQVLLTKLYDGKVRACI